VTLVVPQKRPIEAPGFTGCGKLNRRRRFERARLSVVPIKPIKSKSALAAEACFSGGRASSDPRREFDLYIHVDDVNGLRLHLDGKAEFVEDLHVTFYGMSEFIIRDCNGFWITFAQPIQK
jgi:hypothetical protein